MNNAHTAQTCAFGILMNAHHAGIERVELATRIEPDRHSYDIALENGVAAYTVTISSDNSGKENRALCAETQNWINSAQDGSSPDVASLITPTDTRLLSTALHSGWSLESILSATFETFTLVLKSQGKRDYFSRSLIISKAMNSDHYDVKLYRHVRLDEFCYNDGLPIRKRMRTELVIKLIQEETLEM